MTKRLLVLALTLVACRPGDADGDDASTDGAEETTSETDVVFEDWLASVETWRLDNKIPGVTVAVVVEGEVRYKAGLGQTRRGDKGTDVTPETRFLVGSTTKMTVAAASLSIVADGLLDLDAPVGEVFADFDLADEDSEALVTPHHLLSHTAGLPDTIVTNCPTDAPALAAWFGDHPDLDLWTPPGAVWNYSNLGFSLEGALIEAAAAEPFQEVLARRVFEPLGMSSATFDTQTVLDGDFAYGLGQNDFGAPAAWAPGTWDCALTWAPGQMWSTAADMAKFAAMLALEGEGLLDASQYAAITGPHVDTRMYAGLGYGYGLMVEERSDATLVLHDGAYMGFLTSVVTVPERDFAVVVISNAYNAQPYEVADDAARRFTGLDLEAVPRPPPGPESDYVGTYYDPAYLGDIIVEPAEEGLQVRFPGFEGYVTPLIPSSGDTFFFDGGNGAYYQTTLWREAPEAAPRWFVTRIGVGERVVEAEAAAFRPSTPKTPAELAHQALLQPEFPRHSLMMP